jgi:hypothetical protein
MPGGLDSILDGLTISKRPDSLTIVHRADWLIFVQRLEALVQSGRARRIPPLWRALAYGEEWYLDTDSGEVYVYLSPDSPILPQWKKVDVFSKPDSPGREDGLGAIPTGKMSRSEADSLKEILKFAVRHGAVEVLDRPNSVTTASQGSTETWYKDPRTMVVFRLVECPGDGVARWERVQES